MIRVSYSSEELWIAVEGHAQSGPFGQDLVCAAVSALVLTLWENLRLLEKEEMVESVQQELEGGRAFLACKAKHRFRREAETVFHTVIRGLHCLGRVYPRFLTCTREG